MGIKGYCPGVEKPTTDRGECDRCGLPGVAGPWEPTELSRRWSEIWRKVLSGEIFILIPQWQFRRALPHQPSSAWTLWLNSDGPSQALRDYHLGNEHVRVL